MLSCSQYSVAWDCFKTVISFDVAPGRAALGGEGRGENDCSGSLLIFTRGLLDALFAAFSDYKSFALCAEEGRYFEGESTHCSLMKLTY